jgi:hypothetical protein
MLWDLRCQRRAHEQQETIMQTALPTRWCTVAVAHKHAMCCCMQLALQEWLANGWYYCKQHIKFMMVPDCLMGKC